MGGGGGGASAFGGHQRSKNKSSFGEDVWGPQGDALGDLYGQANQLFGGNQQFANILSSLAGNLGGYNQDILDRASGNQDYMMGGGSIGDSSDIRNDLMSSMRRTGEQGSQMGNMYNSIVGGEGNTYIDPMVDAMKASGQENLDQVHNRNAMSASAAGQGGSNRHAMQNAMATSAMNKNLLNKEMEMRGGAYDKDLGMKMDIARMADSNTQSMQDRMLDMMKGGDANRNAGMGYGSDMQNLGMGTMAPWMQASQQPWDAMNRYSGVIGDPTVLGSGKSSGSSKGTSMGGSVGGSFGG